MSGSSLERHGLYFDDANQLRILDPADAASTGRLIDECGQFISDSNSFQTLVNDFSQLINQLAAQVDAAKIKALGSRNELKSIAKERQNERQQLEALIGDRRLELERLRVQLQSLQRQEIEQQNLLEGLMSRK